jgi:hypothetical protein
MVTLLLAITLFAPPGEAVFSGPQKGEKTPGFKVLDMTGPSAGKEIDHVTEWNGAPTLLCFIHELTRPGAQLMRRLDDYGSRNRDALRTLFVSLTDDVNSSERSLPPAIRALSMKSLIGISPDGREGPGAYGLNKTVLLTILLAKEGKVLENWAIVSPNETDFPKIQAALDKVLEPALDTPESMRTEILRLRAQLSALRGQVEALREAGPAAERRGQSKRSMEKSGETGEASAKKPLPGKMTEDPKLRELFRGLIRPQAAPEEIDRVAGEIEGYLAEKVELKRDLLDSFTLLDHLGYGTDHSKAVRKKLREKYEK